MLKKKYIGTTIELEDKMMEKLNDAAERFGVPKIRIIRACIENELPRLIDRENKRIRERKK